LTRRCGDSDVPVDGAELNRGIRDLELDSFRAGSNTLIELVCEIICDGSEFLWRDAWLGDAH